jgi:hypothetical protein
MRNMSLIFTGFNEKNYYGNIKLVHDLFDVLKPKSVHLTPNEIKILNKKPKKV